MRAYCAILAEIKAYIPIHTYIYIYIKKSIKIYSLSIIK